MPRTGTAKEDNFDKFLEELETILPNDGILSLKEVHEILGPRLPWGYQYTCVLFREAMELMREQDKAIMLRSGQWRIYKRNKKYA